MASFMAVASYHFNMAFELHKHQLQEYNGDAKNFNSHSKLKLYAHFPFHLILMILL